MTDAEVFDNVARRNGYAGRLNRAKRAGTPAGALYAGIDRHAQELIASARQHLPRLPAIHFDFVYDGEVNAFADKEDGQYFVGITSGTFVVLQMMLCRMLSDSRILTHAGEPGSEFSGLPHWSGFIADADRMASAGFGAKRPKTEPRWSYSCYLVAQAALFVIGHEIAHIARGHVDYLNSRTGSGFLPEIGWSQSGAMSLIERQTLEADADQRSLISRLESVRLTHNSKGQTGPPWLTAPPTLEQMLFDCSFSVDLLCRLFGDSRFDTSDLANHKYPPWPLRRAMLRFLTLMYVQSVLGSELAGVATSALRRSAIEIESAFATITGDAVSPGGILDAFSPEARSHVARLGEYWDQGLRDRLAPFAFEVDSAPPGFLQDIPSA